jgi:hypothetical protein
MQMRYQNNSSHIVDSFREISRPYRNNIQAFLTRFGLRGKRTKKATIQEDQALREDFQIYPRKIDHRICILTR